MSESSGSLEAKVKTLRIYRDSNGQYWMEQESFQRLANITADSCIDISLLRLDDVQKETEEQKQKLQQLLNDVLEENKELVRTVCHNILQQPMYGKKLQDTVIYHLENFANILKKRFDKELLK